MFLVITLLIITLANHEAHEMDADLAAKAADEALTQYSEGAYLKIRGHKEFSKEDKSTLADKLRLTLRNPFTRMGTRVRHLPKETTYGCGGILDTEGRSDLMYVACLYNKRK